MLTEILSSPKLFLLLHRIDKDYAEMHKEKRCIFCGGPLHYANYPRKPRGYDGDLPDECLLRYSFCCGREQCRRRNMPPSLRFMGRHCYWQCIIFVVMTLRRNNPQKETKARLNRLLGVSRQTIDRWAAYFNEIFPNSALWLRLRGLVGPHIKNDQLPGALLEDFIKRCGEISQGVFQCLNFFTLGQTAVS